MYISLLLRSYFSPPVSPSITILPSRGAPVYAGTEFVVTAHISFSGPSAVTVPIAVDITWSTVDGNVSNSSRTTVSPVSGGGGSYTASLTFQPITTSDAGQYTATVTFNPPADSMYIRGDSATATHTIAVDGMLGVRVCSLAHVAVKVAGCTVWPTGQISELINWWLSTCALTGCVLLFLLFLPPALPALAPVILSSLASATIGEVAELSCSVPVVEHLVQSPTLDWNEGSEGQPGVAVTDLTTLGGTIWRNISFSPPKTSHGGQYVCQAGLSIPAIGLEETWASSRDLSVQSEWLSCVFCLSVLALHVCPPHSP